MVTIYYMAGFDLRCLINYLVQNLFWLSTDSCFLFKSSYSYMSR